MGDERCIHDLVVGQCGMCNPVPHGLSKHVYVTPGGAVFHAGPDCRALLDGQDIAARYGQRVHRPERVPLVDAVAAGRAPCIPCFPDHVPPPTAAKPCWVRIDGCWTEGQLTRWRRRQDTGRWQGIVSYPSDGTWVTAMFDQDDLRVRAIGRDQRARRG